MTARGGINQSHRHRAQFDRESDYSRCVCVCLCVCVRACGGGGCACVTSKLYSCDISNKNSTSVSKVHGAETIIVLFQLKSQTLCMVTFSLDGSSFQDAKDYSITLKKWLFIRFSDEMAFPINPASNLSHK